jgi:hypothetical protein
MNYEIIETLKYNRIDIENPYEILTNIELTFYLITKK